MSAVGRVRTSLFSEVEFIGHGQLMAEAAARRGEEGTVLSHEPADCGALLTHLSQSCCRGNLEVMGAEIGPSGSGSVGLTVGQ